ncbi:hypothetical protein ACFX19_041704 [Malus domestica]
MGNISSSTATSTTGQSVPDMVLAIRFHPTEEEMADFLWKKMKGHNSQACHSLPVIDVCKFEPWDLPERMFPDTRYQAKAWYSFSQPDYKYINSPRCNRITEKGFWKITGKPRDISSTHVTCKKRTLTFYKGRVSKSERTGWVMHEYYFTKPKQGSNTSQGRDPLRDFVLYRLKKKPANSMSDNKNLQDTLIGDDLTDPGNGSCIASSSGNDQAATAAALNHDMTPAAEELLAYQELEDDLFDSGNHDRGEPGGGISSDSTDQVLRDMIQQWKSCAPVGEYLNSLLTLPESPQPPQPPQLGNAPDVCSDEFVDPSTGGCITCNTDNQDAAMNHMISAEEEILAYKQLERALLGNGDHDDGEPGSGGSSDFNDQAVDDMILELSAELQKDSDSPFPPPEPSQTIQPHQLGDAADVHSGKFSNCPSPTNYDNESVINIVYNSQNRATSERISEAYSQREENRESPFQPFDHYPLQSPLFSSELGELMLANTYIGGNESQSLNIEPATLFPQSS